MGSYAHPALYGAWRSQWWALGTSWGRFFCLSWAGYSGLAWVMVVLAAVAVGTKGRWQARGPVIPFLMLSIGLVRVRQRRGSPVLKQDPLCQVVHRQVRARLRPLG